jgi:hypothetical protein
MTTKLPGKISVPLPGSPRNHLVKVHGKSEESYTNRRLDKLEVPDAQAVKAARRSVNSNYGKALLRRRGMHLERAFAHLLDCGGMRRATLRGLENLNKRFKLAAAFYNLSQLMRKLFRIGTPRQWEALKGGGLMEFAGVLVVLRWATILAIGSAESCVQQILEILLPDANPRIATLE